MIRNVTKFPSSLFTTVLSQSNRTVQLLPWQPCTTTHPLFQCRYKSGVGEYDRMWQSVESGQGKKVVKKKYPDGDFPGYGFGKDNLKIPGFNAPLEGMSEKQRAGFEKADNQRQERAQEPRKPRLFNYATRRGWTGRSWGGRGIGHPYDSEGNMMTDFTCVILETKRVSSMTPTGRRQKCWALVIGGNGKGAFCFGIGKGQDMQTAMKKARNRCPNFMMELPICNTGQPGCSPTIYHDIKIKYRNMHLYIEKKMPGYGVRAHRQIKTMCDLIGLNDLRAKVIGPKHASPFYLTHAVLRALMLQETHQEVADRTGKYLVEWQPGRQRPVIIATPQQDMEYDPPTRDLKDRNVKNFHVPVKDLHLQKSRKHAFGANPQKQRRDHVNHDINRYRGIRY